MKRPVVLVIEDDAPIRRGLVDALHFAGYEALQSADGREAMAMALECDVDLLLLDVMLPGRDGFAILDELRAAKPTLPVIMVTARGAEEDRVRGLKTGADDYIVKPFSARELLARVEAVLRRSPERAGDVHVLDADGCTIDLRRREIMSPEGTVRALSQREADLLRYLAVNRERAVERDELLHRVWGLNPKGIHTRTVDMHIARLREKIENDPSTPRIVLTVRGKGYKLADTVKIRE
ncbi:MAG: response regulator transcription factor [Planctomycetota bacterium]|nr:response regulator transcription factor [Planctomycetota bacterium]